MPQRSHLPTAHQPARSRQVGNFRQRTAVLNTMHPPQIAESTSEFRADLSAIPVGNAATLQAKPGNPVRNREPQSTQGTSSGRSIPTPVRSKMERSFNASFADVRIHEGSHAATLGAIAYTQGNHIHFAPGRFNPETSSGQALLGHELAHVVQQRQGRVRPTGQVNGLPLNDNPALEQEADRLGLKAAHA